MVQFDPSCHTRAMIQSYHIRWMIQRDLPEAVQIDQSTPEQWRDEDFVRALRQRNCIAMVAERGEVIVGFVVYELHKDRLIILKLTVLPDARRSGVGRALLGKLIGKLSWHRRTALEMIVAESNLAGQLFLRAHGFVATAIEHGHFGDEDGYLMRFEIAPDTEVTHVGVHVAGGE